MPMRAMLHEIYATKCQAQASKHCPRARECVAHATKRGVHCSECDTQPNGGEIFAIDSDPQSTVVAAVATKLRASSIECQRRCTAPGAL